MGLDDLFDENEEGEEEDENDFGLGSLFGDNGVYLEENVLLEENREDNGREGGEIPIRYFDLLQVNL